MWLISSRSDNLNSNYASNLIGEIGSEIKLLCFNDMLSVKYIDNFSTQWNFTWCPSSSLHGAQEYCLWFPSKVLYPEIACDLEGPAQSTWSAAMHYKHRAFVFQVNWLSYGRIMDKKNQKHKFKHAKSTRREKQKLRRQRERSQTLTYQQPFPPVLSNDNEEVS